MSGASSIMRRRMLAVVALPLAVVVVGAGWLVAATARDVGAARETERATEAAGAAHELAVALQDERDAAVAYLHALPVAMDARSDAEAATDAQITAIGAAEAAAPPGFEAAAAEAASGLEAILATEPGLGALRVPAPVVVPLVDEDGNELGFAWPVWPDAAAITALDDGYRALEVAIQSLADATPEGTGLVPALDRASQMVGVERVMALGLLLTPEVLAELAAPAPDSGVLPPEPLWPSTYQERFVAAAEVVDARIINVRDAIDALAGSDGFAGARSFLDEAFALLADVSDERSRVRDGTQTPTEAAVWYTNAISALLDSEAAVAQTTGDLTVSSHLSAVVAIDRLIEAIRQEEMYGMRAIREGVFSSDLPRNTYLQLAANTIAALATAQAASVGLADVPPVELGASFDTSSGTSFEGLRSLLAQGDWTPVTVTNRRLDMQADEEVAALLEVSFRAAKGVTEAASSRTSGAATSTTLAILGGVAVVALSIAVALRAARTLPSVPAPAAPPELRQATQATAKRLTKGKGKPSGRAAPKGKVR